MYLYSEVYLNLLFFLSAAQSLRLILNENISFFFNVNNSITILATCFGWDGDNLSWTTPGIGRNMTRLFWLGFVCVILLLSCEYLTYYGNKVHCMLMKLYSHVMLKNSVKEDKYDLNFYESDVSHEKQVVNGADPHNYCLYLK